MSATSPAAVKAASTAGAASKAIESPCQVTERNSDHVGTIVVVVGVVVGVVTAVLGEAGSGGALVVVVSTGIVVVGTAMLPGSKSAISVRG